MTTTFAAPVGTTGTSERPAVEATPQCLPPATNLTTTPDGENHMTNTGIRVSLTLAVDDPDMDAADAVAAIAAKLDGFFRIEGVSAYPVPTSEDF